ncbi:hypothetical protein [Polaribacter sp.]|uniref:hypothetical protein n=1 Tax=Polaribacter sp. TaxID=1920175 RepID=UPI003F6C6F84
MNDISIFEGMKKINATEKIIAKKNNIVVTLTKLENCFIRYINVKNEAKKYSLKEYSKALSQLQKNNFTIYTYKV